LPWFIGEPRDGRHHGHANAAIRAEIETRQKHELSFANQIVIAPLALNVGTALGVTSIQEIGGFPKIQPLTFADVCRSRPAED
jgi:hypothetical protein